MTFFWIRHVLTMHLIQERLPVGNLWTDPSKHKWAQTSTIKHKKRPNKHDQAAGTHITKCTMNAGTNSEHTYEDKDESHELQGQTMLGRLKGEHTHGWPGSVPVGLHTFKIETQICVSNKVQVTQIRRSSTCENTSTCHLIKKSDTNRIWTCSLLHLRPVTP